MRQSLSFKPSRLNVFQTLALILLGLLSLTVGPTVQAARFTVESQDIKSGQSMPSKHVFNSFGCTGENQSPHLRWKGAPAGTQSFAITVYDPDAPTGSGWWHWTVANLPSTTTELPTGASGGPKSQLPQGAVEGRTDFGKPGYGGPCPPPGDRPHRYIFTVYALKTAQLELDSQASGAMFGYYLKQNSLAHATLTVHFGRKKP